MNQDTRLFINDLAKNVIDCYQISIPIKNIENVVTAIGGTIGTQSELSDEAYDGAIQKTGQDSFRIVVSPYQSEKRKNFTVAHELGHLFLHMGYQTDPEEWARQGSTQYHRFGTSEQEYQANEFAAALLMPAEKYRSILNSYSQGGYVDTEKIAQYFNVSTSAAVNRGKFLGFFA